MEAATAQKVHCFESAGLGKAPYRFERLETAQHRESTVERLDRIVPERIGQARVIDAAVSQLTDEQIESAGLGKAPYRFERLETAQHRESTVERLDRIVPDRIGQARVIDAAVSQLTDEQIEEMAK